MRFGYYRADWWNGKRPENHLEVVRPYTDFTYCEAGQIYHGSWAAFRRALRRAKRQGFGIHLNFQRHDPLLVIQHARLVWDAVELVDLIDEPSWRKREMGARVEDLREAIARAGLEAKPIGAVFSQKLIQSGNGWEATALDWRGIEGYVDPKHQGSIKRATDECRRVLHEQLDKLPRGKRNPVVIVGQAFDRGSWSNMPALAAIQDETYEVARKHPRVTHLRWFDYGGKGGTQDHPSLAERHEAIVTRDRNEED